MAKRGRGEEEKDRSRAGETKPIDPADEGVERPIWKEPKPTEREEEKDRSRAGETRPTGPETEGVERPIWQEPKPTEREAKATETADNTDSNTFLSNSGDSALDADMTDEGRRGLAKEDGAELKDPKAELGTDDDTTWLKDPKAELGSDDDSDWLKDPKAELGVTSAGNDEALERPTTDFAGVEPPLAGDPVGLDVGPISREGSDEGDPEAIVWPEFQEGPESIDAENEDADWDDDAPEMEVEVDIDDDVDTHEDVDEETFKEVDVDEETFEEVDVDEDEEM